MSKKYVRASLFAAAGVFYASFATAAGTISPSSVSASIGIGETITINKTVTLGDVPTNLDVFFLADNTGSMGGLIGGVQSQASFLLSALQTTYGVNTGFGVGRYWGDISEGCGSPPGCGYQRQQAISTTAGDAQTAINAWTAGGGGDTPEANLYALQQMASDAGTGWRLGSERIAIWFGDAPGHTETTTEAQAIAALVAAGVKVAALNLANAGSGIDGTYDGSGPQATNIVAGAGGTKEDNIATLSNAELAAAIIAAIGTITSTTDIVLSTDFVGTGLTIGFDCTDALGCLDVPAGASRTFDMTVTGNTAGVYNFNVYATGIAAFETDKITVPEPASLALLSLGLGAMGWSRRRGKQA